MISSGIGKSDVFKRLSGQELTDKILAYYVAAFPDPDLLKKCRMLVNILFIAICVQLGIGLLLIPLLVITLHLGLIFSILIFSIAAILSWLITRGFKRNNGYLYNGYLILVIAGLPNQISESLAQQHISASSIIGLAISVAIFFYVLYVRNKIFPDLGFFGVKKKNGKYVFTSKKIRSCTDAACVVKVITARSLLSCH